MSVDATTLVIPGHGTVFYAPVNTKPPTNPLGAFNIQADGPTVWKNLGHTSKQNTIAFTKEGGEKESLDTFLADGVRTTTGSTSWGVNVAALQFDKNNLDLAFNGDFDPSTGGYTVASPAPLPVSLFLYFQDTTASVGFWLPNTEISLGDAPSVDTANFLEMPLTASVLSADNATIPAVNGRPGVFQIFKTGLTAGVPILNTALPSGAAAGQQVTITGSGFTGLSGAAAVKFGATNAAAYTVVNSSTIVASLPAGSAGSAPIVVTNGTGASTALAYTRGA
ncbi:IPT/TIG domain-containing protein [Microbacterium sp. K24]|uniref:IPT/TIG domain-containing protein n=1 Tax=Microbacterium sp. K24 TaxID=2305446 RepID=UPI00109D80CE|nr:IPT/TIG domain-containing protein [Microbacterium sp. K24]